MNFTRRKRYENWKILAVLQASYALVPKKSSFVGCSEYHICLWSPTGKGSQCRKSQNIEVWVSLFRIHPWITLNIKGLELYDSFSDLLRWVWAFGVVHKREERRTCRISFLDNSLVDFSRKVCREKPSKMANCTGVMSPLKAYRILTFHNATIHPLSAQNDLLLASHSLRYPPGVIAGRK